MSYKELSISCIIPVYNEAANVKSVINESESLFEKLQVDYEIVIIESGSTDGTWEEINKLIINKERIFAFHQDKREGMGSALRLGYTKCHKDIVCHFESDSPFDITNFRRAIPILLENECVIGYRIGKKEHNYKWYYRHLSIRNMLLRLVFHVGYNLILRIIFRIKIRDVNFSFKLFRREHIQKLHLISNGWFVDAEILLELIRVGIFPVELPVEYNDRIGGKSSVRISDPIYILYEMLKYIKIRKESDTG
jgi:glycosyltransferase involved in cell wall biosynthesis